MPQVSYSRRLQKTKSSLHTFEDEFDESLSDQSVLEYKERITEGGNIAQEKEIMISSDEKDFLLKIHNEKRAEHNAHELQWNDILAEQAGRWAKHLADIDALEYEECVDKGQNIAQAKDVNEVMRLWYDDESKNYNYDKPKFSLETKNFTQVVWAGSREMGVGHATSKRSGRTYFVARYFPAGNVEGNFASDVNKPSGSDDDDNPKVQDGRLIKSFMVGFVAFVLILSSTISNYWLKSDNANQGLWSTCNQSLCSMIKRPPEYLNNVKGFSILALGAIFLALVLCFGKFFTTKMKQFVHPAVVFGMAVIFQLISVSLYVIGTRDEQKEYGWSFWLTWVGIGFAVLTCLLMAFVK